MMKIDSSWYIRTTNVPTRTAAGGIVVRRENQEPWIALTVEERKFTELPKGGIEKGETLEEAAHREVVEETGITELTLVFPKPFYIEQRYGFYKKTWMIIHYFLYITDQIDATPQDPHHTLLWVPLKQLPDMFWFKQKEWLMKETEQIQKLAWAFAEDGPI